MRKALFSFVPAHIAACGPAADAPDADALRDPKVRIDARQ